MGGELFEGETLPLLIIYNMKLLQGQGIKMKKALMPPSSLISKNQMIMAMKGRWGRNMFD